MVLTQDVINDFKNTLERLENTLKLKDLCPTYDEIVESVMAQTKVYLAEHKITNATLESILRNRRKTKYRWLKADNITLIPTNASMTKRIPIYLEWLNDNRLLCEYPHITNKGIKSIKSSIKNDITVEIYKMLLDFDNLHDLNDMDNFEDTKIDNQYSHNAMNVTQVSRHFTDSNIISSNGNAITQEGNVNLEHSNDKTSLEYGQLVSEPGLTYIASHDSTEYKPEKRVVSKVTNVLTTIPYNTSKDGSFTKLGGALAEQGTDVTYNEKSMQLKDYSFVIEFNDNEPRTRLELRNEENVRKVFNKINQVLNSTDRKIFNYLISQITSEFINTGSVLVSVKDIADNVFEGGKSGDNYLSIKSSIFKMEKIKCYLGNRKSSIVIGLISYFEFFTKDGKDLLQVDIHAYIRDEIIKKHTINLYKDVIDNCPDDDTELLMYFLQRKRLSLVLAHKSLEITVDYYDFFSNAIFFTNKRHDRNLARLLKCLTFIKNTDSIIETYVRNRNMITLRFKPITEDELNDLNYENILDDSYTEFRDKLIDEPQYFIP